MVTIIIYNIYSTDESNSLNSDDSTSKLHYFTCCMVIETLHDDRILKSTHGIDKAHHYNSLRYKHIHDTTCIKGI